MLDGGGGGGMWRWWKMEEEMSNVGVTGLGIV